MRCEYALGDDMANDEHELMSLIDEFEQREAGVVDLMDLYGRIEAIYVRASASTSDSDVVHTSDSTNAVGANG